MHFSCRYPQRTYIFTEPLNKENSVVNVSNDIIRVMNDLSCWLLVEVNLKLLHSNCVAIQCCESLFSILLVQEVNIRYRIDLSYARFLAKAVIELSWSFHLDTFDGSILTKEFL